MVETKNGIEDSRQDPVPTQSEIPVDPALDWARYQSQFDRIDGEVRHRMHCLITLDGVLLFVLIAWLATQSLIDRDFSTTTLWFFLPWLGMSFSLGVYWSQFRTNEYRRELQRAWMSRYPNAYPMPCGMLTQDPGSLHLAPGVLLGLLSSVFWSVVFGVSLGFAWWSGDQQSLRTLNSFQFFGALVLGAVSILTLYFAATARISIRTPEGDQQ
jgi:hypothetical protein